MEPTSTPVSNTAAPEPISAVNPIVPTVSPITSSEVMTSTPQSAPTVSTMPAAATESAAVAVAKLPAPPTDEPTLHPMSSLSLAERGQLFFRKYQFINGENLDPIEAEQRVRAEYHIVPLTDVEITAARSKNIFQKIADHPAVTSISATLLGGTKKNMPGAVSQSEVAIAQPVAPVAAPFVPDAVVPAEPALVATSPSISTVETPIAAPLPAAAPATPTAAAPLADVPAAPVVTTPTHVSPLQSIRDLAAQQVVHVAEKIAGHAVTDEKK